MTTKTISIGLASVALVLTTYAVLTSNDGPKGVVIASALSFAFLAGMLDCNFASEKNGLRKWLAVICMISVGMGITGMVLISTSPSTLGWIGVGLVILLGLISALTDAALDEIQPIANVPSSEPQKKT